MVFGARRGLPVGVVKAPRMCYNLENVFIRALTPPSISSGIFAECHENLTIYVPEQSVEEYRSADVWSVYSDRIVGYLYND